LNTGPDQPVSPADLLLHLSRRVRHAESIAELRFIAVNETRALAPYRQAALWLSHDHALTLSGVVSVEANAPYAQWLQRVCRSLAGRSADGPLEVTAALLESQDASEWQEWLPAHGLWLPLLSENAVAGGLLLARDEPWQPLDLQLLGEWREIWWHEFERRVHQASRRSWWGSFGGRAAIAAAEQSPGGHALPKWKSVGRNVWRSRWQRFGILALLVALIPVRLTVLAPGELVPKNPSAIRAPLEGTVDRFFVVPNQRVKKDDPLLQLDLTALNSKLSVAQQELATAEAEYRQAAQQAVFEARSKSQLAMLQGRISERKTEVSYLASQLKRAQIVAPRDGVALVDDPSEWIGKPVATGEKVMTIADEYDVEVEAWLAPGDLIDIPSDTAVTLYLNAAPLDPVAATLLYAAHEAVARPDGSFAYRLRAQIKPDQARQRVGLKGTTRISGRRVPLIYWVLRRPLATLRPYIGI
jgi:multidrug efflux pump subunit AcrA (membrane-fusion protein)